MASFPAEILLTLAGVGAVEGQIKKLETRFEKLQRIAGDIAIGAVKGGASGGIKLATRNVNDYVNTLGKLDKRLGGLGGRLAEVAKAFDFGGKTVVGVAGINALSSALQELPRWAGGANGALQGFASVLQQITAPVNLITDALQAMGPAGMATAGGIAAATAAAMAFGPAIRRAGQQAEDFKNSFTGSFEVTQDILSEKTIRDALKAAVSEQKKLSAGTLEYTQKTEEVLAIQRELTAELRRQQTVLNMVNKEQIDIANTVRRNINESARGRGASGFADFSQRAGAQTAIDKSIRRQREKLAKAARSAPAAAAPLMLPSSDMLNATERGIKRIRSVTDQLGQDLDYTNQEVANFINGLKTGANEAVKLPKIFDAVGASLKEAVAATQKLEGIGKPVQGPGNDKGIAAYKERIKLADLAGKLEQNWTKKLNSLRVKQDAARYRLEQRRIKRLADQQKKADKARNQRLESIALGVGFPLLFGGGAGSVGGSLAGSFVGSGFGGQIAGGAIGQAIDNYIQGMNDLARSLKSTTDIISGLETAGYKVSESTKRTIESYEKGGQFAAAYSVALEEVNRVLGPGGAVKLDQYRQEVEKLDAEFQEAAAALQSELLPAMTGLLRIINGLKSALDALANNPIAKKAIGAGLETAFGAGLLPAKYLYQGLSAVGAPASDKIKNPDSVVFAEQDRAEAEFKDYLKREAAAERSLELAQLEGAVLKAGTDILDDQVFLAKEKLILDETDLKLQNDKLTKAERELIIQQQINKLRGLANTRADAENRDAEKRLREAERAANEARQIENSRLNIEKEIGQERQKQAELDLRFEELTKGRLAATQKERAELQARYDAEEAIIDIAEQQALLNDKENNFTQLILQSYQLKRDVLRDTLGIRSIELDQLEKQLKLERELAVLADERAKAKELATLDQSATKLGLQLANPFGGDEVEQRLLALDQEFEKTQRITAEKEKLSTLESQRAIATIGSDDFKYLNEDIKRQKAFIVGLEERITKENELEMAILKQQQTLERLKPITDSLAAGITDFFTSIIDGSKSAEEAFADMLKNMGQVLIQTAAQMIAQYIAIGIARAFAGMGSGSGAQNNPLNPVIPGVNNLPKRASGGSTFADRPYLVGENGPELFVPQTSGRVVNNTDSQMALERYTYQDNNPAKPPQPISVQYNVTDINGMRFVTEDQLQRASAAAAQQGAKSGETRVMSSLRNSRSRRKSLGL